MKQTKEPNKTNLNKSNFRNKNAITLIALVVTIVVLLILAGVTISLLLDENGIIAKSKDARLENRASQVEDEIGMWKQNNFINKESDQAQEEADTILESLITRKLLTEDEIDREQEIITIKKKDGSILKQISYSQVTINIRKQPETGKSGAVILTVDSVEGTLIPTITNEKEFSDFLNSLSETQKKEIIKFGYIKSINKEDSTTNCKTFEDVLKLLSDEEGQEITEEIFWESIERSERGLDGATIEILLGIYYNKSTRRIEGYTVTNPDGETSNTYIATENGIYTFKVQDIITGKTYTKKVEVTNIDKAKPANVAKAEIIEGNTYVYLFDAINKEYITFEKAYIILDGEKIEINNDDIGKYDKDGNWTGTDIKYNCIQTRLGQTLWQLVEEGKLVEEPNLYGTVQTFVIVKDGIEYTANVLITRGAE